MSLQTAITPSVEIPISIRQLMCEIMMIVSPEQMKTFLDFMVVLSTGCDIYAEHASLCDKLYGILPSKFQDQFKQVVLVYAKHHAQDELKFAVQRGNADIVLFLLNNRDVKIDTTWLQNNRDENVKCVIKAELTAREIGLFQ